MAAKKKSKLQKKKDDPKSKYWKTKADELWGSVIHEIYQRCAVNNEDCAGPVEAHHLITRGNVCTRHNVENGIGLCSSHHKWSPKLSAHMAPLAFTEWLQEHKPDTWEWCSQNKHKTGKPNYRQAYDILVEWCTDNAPYLIQ